MVVDIVVVVGGGGAVVVVVVDADADGVVAVVVAASSSYAVDEPFDVVVEDNKEHYWVVLNQIEQLPSMASKQTEALSDDEVEVAYHRVDVDVGEDDSWDREVQAFLVEQHQEEVYVHHDYYYEDQVDLVDENTSDVDVAGRSLDSYISVSLLMLEMPIHYYPLLKMRKVMVENQYWLLCVSLDDIVILVWSYIVLDKIRKRTAILPVYIVDDDDQDE